jgi:hypothetical protein
MKKKKQQIEINHYQEGIGHKPAGHGFQVVYQYVLESIVRDLECACAVKSFLWPLCLRNVIQNLSNSACR